MGILKTILVTLPNICLIAGMALPNYAPQSNLTVVTSLGLVLVGICGWFVIIGVK